MFYLMAAFCVGPIILYCYGELLPAFIYILFSICCLGLVKTRLFLPLLSCLLGLLFTHILIAEYLEARLDRSLDSGSQTIEAYVCSVPVDYHLYSKADFCVLEASDNNGKILGKKVRLSFSHTLNLDLKKRYYKLSVVLKPPRASLNFVGSSFEQYLFYKKISAIGRIVEVLESAEDEAGFTLADRVRSSLNSYRMSLGDYLNNLLLDKEHKGLLRALILGDRGQISPGDSRVLQYTGTQHLLAISGLHVGLVMFFLYKLLVWSAFRVPVVAFFGLAYVIMVGGSESAIRAWVMSVLALVLLSGRWRRDYLAIYCAAMFMVLLFDPLSPMNIGFWYSFICVALLILLSRFALNMDASWRSLLLLQLVLIVGLAPINALIGNVQGLASLLGNMFAVPWVSLFVLPVSLVALGISFLSRPVGEILMSCSDAGLELLVQYLSSLIGLLAEFSFGASNVLLIPYAVLFLSFVFFIRNYLLRAVFLAVLLLVLYTPSVLKELKSEVLVFDAGQGLAIALIWGGQYWLYDTGLALGSYSLVESAVFPYFREQELLLNISGLIVSHGDADHAGGAARVEEYLQPTHLWSGEPGRVSGLMNEKPCAAGMSWEYTGGRLEVLYPFAAGAEFGASSNNRSCVLRFTYRGQSFLLMGDLEGEAEMHLVERYRDSLKADVLIAGHHGSANATSIALLKNVQPKILVISAAYMNRFGHPHADVLERSRLMGVEVLSTASHGALRFLLGGEAINVAVARIERETFWSVHEDSVNKN
ncbi:hypothetical protein A3766_00625 [Oleiphilus sp. HI0132]|uniref:DNA internalization-related competence protein ComEC/Rec2 n=1 Tax=Oleiphilus sp. HI0132 TaxID=1822270 RepID=UPI0007C22494|nr:DNA internalization-related competence protein ComEC/Rec2 [Oleiphilus sp. HI0132]KZZ73161.1 hypothetical protein A3766_00625 [Oleiphilus sp. HI0132]